MASEHILILLSDPQVSKLIERTTLKPAGYTVTLEDELEAAEALIRADVPDILVVGDRTAEAAALEWVERVQRNNPELPIIVLVDQKSTIGPLEALRLGAIDYLRLPVPANDILLSVRRALEHGKHWKDWVKLQSRQSTDQLRKKLDELEVLGRIGRSVTASLDLDGVLANVVEAAVEITKAEEGSLLLLDDESDELYVRASKNFQDEFVRTFRLPIDDTLAGQVVRTGEPVVLDEKTPQKIKTSYLVHTLIYVPLQAHGRTIGVLGVDNRRSGHSFSEHHLALVSAMADYAAIAIENASLYTRSEVERNKLETILKNIADGVIVANRDGQLVMVNHTARIAFGLGEQDIAGRPVQEIFQNSDLLEMFREGGRNGAYRYEITIEDGRIFNAQLTPISEVDLVAVTMQDITHLKELDRIKSDFVNTVSHDLRSPLTAILGYVELIERIGPVTGQQREYIRRVQLSVSNITELINDLLDLGRIEAGFDSRKEIVHLPELVEALIVDLRGRLSEKEHELIREIQEDTPPILGNLVRLRQMLGNLLGNAIEYTQPGGKIRISLKFEGGQVILRVSDNGPGIPASDQPYIFDKFFRGSNVPSSTSGTGLGLAIVKSIVDNHQGRIWVDSNPGPGTTFTVVLPLAEKT